MHQLQISTPIARLIIRSLCSQAAGSGGTQSLADLIELLINSAYEQIKAGGIITGTSSAGHSVNLSVPPAASTLSQAGLAETISYLADLLELGEAAGVPPEEMCAWMLANLVKRTSYRDDFQSMEVTA